jgi:predicted Fe-Mo cluster-binding NifX family protein
MKIAVPTKEKNVDDHFGHCAYFTVFTTGDKKEIISEEVVPSPAGCGCKSNIVHTLSQLGVQVMLAGNMGDGAVNVLNSKGIKVVRGCSGNAKTVTEKWLEGAVVDSGIVCHEHEHGCHNG